MLFERAVASESPKKMRLAVVLLCLMYGWAQEEVEEIIGAAEMAVIDAEFGGNASMMSNVTFTENGGNATTVPDTTFTETGGSAVVVPPTTSPKDIDFDEVDKRKGETFKELFRGMTVCTGHARKTKIASEKRGKKVSRRFDCDVFVGHIWIDRPSETLPFSVSRLRVVQGCITVYNSGLRELNLSSLSLLIYNEIRCRPYVLRLVDNEHLRSITFHKNFTMPDSHLILVAGKHNLTEESIKLLMGDRPLPKDSEDCRVGKGRCKVFYGSYEYKGDDERLSTFKRIEGRLHVLNTKLTNLSIFEKVTVVALNGIAVEIAGNYELEDISSLFKMKLIGPEPIVKWNDNRGRWCHRKADLKLLSRITQRKPYELVKLEWYVGNVTVNEKFLKKFKEHCSCGCGVRGFLIIEDLNGAAINDIQFELRENVDLIDAYMENLVKIHGTAELRTCYDLPKRTVKLFEDLIQGRAHIARDRSGKCPSELIEKDCVASNNDELKVVLHDQSIRRLSNAQGHNFTLCEHFYGYMKLHASESKYGEVGFIQHLKTITGCLDIVNVTNSIAGKNGTSQFEELDLTNLAKIDYDGALCGNIFALRIMRNKFLRRIDFNENLTLNGGYFIRMNSDEGKIYFGGNLNTTFLWSDPKDCVPEDPNELLVNCTNLIGPVFPGSLLPELFTSKQIKRIYGQLIIRSTKYNDLDAYGYLTIIADNKDAVIIENNKDLRDITALTKMNITLLDKFPKEASEKWKPVVVRNNGKICLKSRRDEENVRKRVSTPLQFSDFCRQRCAGGIVTDLTRLRSCQIVMGGLTIKDYDFETASNLLRYFGEIEDVEGQLIIMNNTGIKNLAFLKSLLRVSDYTTKRPIFRVADNPNLTSIEPLHKVELEYSHYEVHLAALIETYSKISDHEQKELGTQRKVEFRVKERLHPTKGRRSKRKRDRKENADNLGVGIALSVGGCLIITIFGYGYSFFAYLREQRELKRQQQPGGGQAAPVERAP
ncbi:hypothetical protein V3C99_012580 [Haemonchus contortus]